MQENDKIYQIPLHRLLTKFGAKNRLFRIFWNEFSKTYKMLQAMKQDAQAASFLILIFSRESQNFSKITFFILKSQFIDLKNVKIIGRHSHLNTMSSSGGVLTKYKDIRS